jgi:hypothetical protein
MYRAAFRPCPQCQPRSEADLRSSSLPLGGVCERSEQPVPLYLATMAGHQKQRTPKRQMARLFHLSLSLLSPSQVPGHWVCSPVCPKACSSTPLTDGNICAPGCGQQGHRQSLARRSLFTQSSRACHSHQ